MSSSIAGDLRVARIDAIDLPVVRAQGVKFFAPNGIVAIDVARATVALDLGAFLDGQLAFDWARVEGGVVRIIEDGRGKNTMEETFRAPYPSSEETSDNKGKSTLDMRSIATSDMVLVIGGGDLPKLRLVDIQGIMRIHELPNRNVVLRFDQYRGAFVEGLPSGRLDFRNVRGHVQTEGKRLLRFEGVGQSEGEPVTFDLDIFTEPKNRVKINAYFPKRSAETFSTRLIALYTKLSSGMDLEVHVGKR